MTEDQKYLLSKLKYVKQFMTTLILGNKACTLFKQAYKGDLHTLRSADDVREFKNKYDFPTDEVLVFEDLSLMTADVQASLLKFIEEPIRPLVVLCSKDNISDAMMSRFMYYIKMEDNLIYKPMDPEEFIKIKLSAEDKIKTHNESDLTSEEEFFINNLQGACMKYNPLFWEDNQKAKSSLSNMSKSMKDDLIMLESTKFIL